MAYLITWLLTSTLALLALPMGKAAIFGLIILGISQLGVGILMLPFGLLLGLFEKDVIKRGKIIDKYFMLFQFFSFLFVAYFAYQYSPLLPIAVVAGYLYWYFSYKYQEKKYKQSLQ